MNVRDLEDERGPVWAELEALTARAGKDASRLDGDAIVRFAGAYRATAADLALARRRYSGDPVVTRLEGLVVRARHLVYARATRALSPVQYLSRGYWRQIVRHRVPLLLATVALFAPAVLAGTWAVRDPGAAGGLIPDAYRVVTEPRTEADLGLAPGERAEFASMIFTNNIRVALFAFAAGVLLGIGTLLILAYNGVLLGTVTGLAVGSGNGDVFFRLVSPHGVLELSCIVVAGAAGLALGWSIVDPGRRTRGESATRQARRSIGLALGTAPWLVLAGLIEGFVTPTGQPLGTALAVGFGLGALYWLLIVWRGRNTAGR